MINLDELPNRLPNETIVLFLRRHWIDLVKTFLFSGTMFIMPLAVGILLNFANPALLTNVFWGPTLVVLLISYLLIALVLTCAELTNYWLDAWIVTNERIINTEQLSLFNRVVSELYLYKIQDVTSETRGLLATFLTFGDVYVQTAGERERFNFKNVDNPDDVKIAITGLANTCKHTHNHRSEVTEEMVEKGA